MLDEARNKVYLKIKKKITSVTSNLKKKQLKKMSKSNTNYFFLKINKNYLSRGGLLLCSKFIKCLLTRRLIALECRQAVSGLGYIGSRGWLPPHPTTNPLLPPPSLQGHSVVCCSPGILLVFLFVCIICICLLVCMYIY